METIDWFGAYNSGLKGIIADEAFSHPAKFSYGLITRIYSHLLGRGYIQEGDLVADPFAGVGIGGIVAAANGLHWIGVELEAKFVQLAEDSFSLHKEQWEKMGKPYPIILQGDSRQFSFLIREAVDSVITSPPFGQAETRDRTPYSGGRVAAMMKDAYIQSKQGETPGQIGAMKEGELELVLDEVVAGIVTSPPWQQTGVSDHKGQTDALKEGKFQGGGDAFLDADYGQSPGQLGGMPEGDYREVVDAICTSPPYASAGWKADEDPANPIRREKERRKLYPMSSLYWDRSDALS